MAEHCLPLGSSKLIPYFALLVDIAFVFPIQLSLSQPTGFLAFTLFNSLPNPAGGRVSKQLHSTWLLTGVKPQHSPILCCNTGHPEKFRVLRFTKQSSGWLRKKPVLLFYQYCEHTQHTSISSELPS